MRAAGPATRPMTTAPTPLSTRARIAVRRHADAAARPPGERGPDGEDRPATGRHRAHDGAGPLLAADELGEPDRLEGLEDDHRDRPEDLDDDDDRAARGWSAAARARRARRPAPPWPRRRPGAGPRRRRGRGAPGAAARVASRCTTLRTTKTTTGSSSADAPVKGCHQTRAPDTRAPPAMLAAEHRALGREGAVDVGAGRGRVHGVDEPRLERPRVERPEDAGQHRRGEEDPERLGDDEHRARHDVDDRRRDEDRPSPEGIGEAARRQLEEEDREPDRRRHRQGLGHGEPALELPQGEQPDDEPDREPAGEAEHEEDPACGGGGEDGIRPARLRCPARRDHQRPPPASGAGRGRGGRRRRRPRCVGPADCPAPHGDSAR